MTSLGCGLSRWPFRAGAIAAVAGNAVTIDGADCNLSRYNFLDAACNAWHYSSVEIESVRHKALRGFAETGNPRGVIEPERLQRMLAFLAAAQGIDDLAAPPNFGFHALTGHRHGYFAMTVTKNWRLTFTVIDETTLAELDIEDYH